MSRSRNKRAPEAMGLLVGAAMAMMARMRNVPMRFVILGYLLANQKMMKMEAIATTQGLKNFSSILPFLSACPIPIWYMAGRLFCDNMKHFR